LISAYTLNNLTFIVMSYEEGTSLDTYLNDSQLTAAKKDQVLRQLRSYVKQMRELKGEKIGGVYTGGCDTSTIEQDIRDNSEEYGPYTTEADFNEGMVKALDHRLSCNSQSSPQFRRASRHQIEQMLRALSNHDIVFCYNKLQLSNMLVREDGILVLLDWSSAGFWPEYWEFCSAIIGEYCFPDWMFIIEKTVKPHYPELAIMNQYHRYLWGEE